jgi:hypothetical protein
LTYYVCVDGVYPNYSDVGPVPVPAVAAGAGVETLFGTNTGHAVEGVDSSGAECILGDVLLTAAKVAGGIPALGQMLQINSDGKTTALYVALGGNKFGGDDRDTFALPNLQGAAPNGLTYYICVKGRFPSREPGRY